MSDQFLPPSDGDIVLDADGVAPIHGWVPAPSGVYTLQIEDAGVEPTSKGGRQIKLRNRIVEGPLAGRSIGIENIYIPDKERQDPEAYKTTMGYFLGKVEAITGKPYAGRINARELVGMRFKAIVILEDRGYGPQNRISTFLPLNADTSGVVIPQPSGTAKPRGDSNGGGAVQDTAGAGRFKI